MPEAGKSAVSECTELMRGGLLSPADVIALHAMDPYSRDFLPELHKTFGAPLVGRGYRFSADLGRCKWTQLGNGKMGRGRIFERRATFAVNLTGGCSPVVAGASEFFVARHL